MMAGSKQQKNRRQKHVPQRTCVVCREKMDKRSLKRLVLTPELGVVADPSGKQNGRGAYLCTKLVCWEKMSKTSVLDQALKQAISAENKAALLEQFKQTIEELSHA
jgi:predicted RNA-binding protein YlxR (DUF448 family)